MGNNLYRNSEGYYDPTAGAALSRMTREERRRVYKPLVYVCSRFAGDVSANIRAARKYCAFAVKAGAIPVAPHLLYPQILNDKNLKERNLGLFFGKILMDKCDEVWIFSNGDYSDGMRIEYKRAIRKGYKIRYFLENCREVKCHGNGGGNESV